MFGLMSKAKYEQLELNYQELELNYQELELNYQELERGFLHKDKEIAELDNKLRLSENNLRKKMEKVSELEITLKCKDDVIAGKHEEFNLRLEMEIVRLEDIRRELAEKLADQVISYNKKIEELKERHRDELERSDRKKFDDKNRVIKGFLKKGMQIYHRNNDITNGLGGYGYIEVVDIDEDSVMCNVKGEVIRFRIDSFGTMLSPDSESRNTDKVITAKVKRQEKKQYLVDKKFWPSKELGGRYHR